MWLTKAHTSQEAPTSTSGSSSLACSNTDNQTKYVDRKAPREKEEIEEVQKQKKYYSDTSVLEDVTIQVISDMLDLGLKILISTIIPGAFN